MEKKDRAEVNLEKWRESSRNTQKLIDDINRSLEESKIGPPSKNKILMNKEDK